MLNLKERVAVVTGGARGIGLEISRAFRDAGASVIVLDRDEELLKDAAADLGAGVLPLMADVASRDSIESAFHEGVGQFGGLDVLVNNAGVRSAPGVANQSVDDWQRTLNVNLMGTFLCTQAALPYFMDRGKGKVVNIGSMTATLALRNRPAFVASKAGVVGLTRALAVDLGPQNVYCNVINPGMIATPLSAEYLEQRVIRERVAELTPLGRPGSPADVAQAALFLASDASDYITGAELKVDGGYTAGKSMTAEL